MRNVVALPLVLALAISFAASSVGCKGKTADATPAIVEDDASSGAAMWGANYFPNIPLTTMDGKNVKFFDDLVKDKVVAVNFIYTKCADACPMETARLLEVQKLLGDRMGKDIHFYSISIDPEHDTPEVLKAYATNWKTGPGWTFLTGKDADITLLRKKLGVYDADTKKKDHSLSMVIGNQKTGRWMKRSPAENPYVLATQLGSWLHNWKLPQPTDRNYENAPEVRNISDGEEMFRARCSSCHTVGGGDKDEVDERRVGPDLFNVVKQRDRAWLERWIREPDVMLKEGDPLATKLLGEYKGINMPNLRLNTGDVTILLKYLEEESKGVEHRAELARTAAMNAAAAAGGAAPEAGAPVAPMAALPDPAKAPANDSLAAYEALRAHLAADDLPAAQKDAATVADAATKASTAGGPARQGLADLAAAAKAINTAADMVAARAAFGELSKNVVALMVGNPNLRTGHYLFLCPMATGYQKWVQTSQTLNNPYWGKRMLTCGKELTSWAI
jgi:protein SCO1